MTIDEVFFHVFPRTCLFHSQETSGQDERISIASPSRSASEQGQAANAA